MNTNCGFYETSDGHSVTIDQHICPPSTLINDDMKMCVCVYECVHVSWHPAR